MCRGRSHKMYTVHDHIHDWHCCCSRSFTLARGKPYRVFDSQHTVIVRHNNTDTMIAPAFGYLLKPG